MRLLLAAAGVVALSLVAGAWRWARSTRAWRPEEVPVAFWAWRDETPGEEDLGRAARATGARTLFLRAGQLDYTAASGRAKRIRAARGRFPRGVELHLVYNATRSLLAGFERVDEAALAAAVLEAFRSDVERATGDGARVAGLQLDVDVPTWMESAELKGALAACDFWVPQFYGAEIPATEDRLVPISSPREVARSVARARALGKPFYAGLAAYGYALLYSPEGKLVALRGDLDPSRVARDTSFELVGRRAFESRPGSGGGDPRAPLASGWRYVFRAQGDTVLDGLAVRAGERVVLDMPSSESLRASVRGVREAAGEKLLGICIFRLPTPDDPTTLSAEQIAAALRDQEAAVSVRLSAGAARTGGGEGKATGRLVVSVENDGAAGALFGDDALSVTLRVPRGGVRGVASLEGFDSFETLCEALSTSGAASSTTLRPCAPARATRLRLRARTWPSGAKARVGLVHDGDWPEVLTANVAVRADDGRAWEQEQRLSVRTEEGR